MLCLWGTVIMEYDDMGPPRIFISTILRKRIEGTRFVVGSSSTFSLANQDTEFRHDVSVDEEIDSSMHFSLPRKAG